MAEIKEKCSWGTWVGWLNSLSIWLFNLAQVMMKWSWDWIPCWAPRWAYSLCEILSVSLSLTLPLPHLHTLHLTLSSLSQKKKEMFIIRNSMHYSVNNSTTIYKDFLQYLIVLSFCPSNISSQYKWSGYFSMTPNCPVSKQKNLGHLGGSIS